MLSASGGLNDNLLCYGAVAMVARCCWIYNGQREEMISKNFNLYNTKISKYLLKVVKMIAMCGLQKFNVRNLKMNCSATLYPHSYCYIQCCTLCQFTLTGAVANLIFILK